ncbi:MAG: NAD(P)/FAD-dependent oxidoreductase [Acidimicrobiales bacterium]|nr:NAD(P)/FAD-dependent oxidoreductase [Acidimicrobiales bacterium]
MNERESSEIPSYGVVIIGAGVSGLYQLYKSREIGVSALVLESGTDVGGTWYWNRYPGARFDSESYSYGYSFSQDLLDQWDWQERFSAQPENLRYLQHVAEQFDLRSDIRFQSVVTQCTFDETSNEWQVEVEDGFKVRCRFLVTAIGILSKPLIPDFDGMEDFKGPSFHTAQWPHDEVVFTGKRVGIIGTGATAVQLIQEVAKTAEHLTVFQRSPNWCAPLHNGPIDPTEMADIRSRYDEIFERCRKSFSGFIHDSDERRALDVSEEEREALYEELYASPGFGIWIGNFRDVLVDEAANATLSDFIARKIRERVDDGELAEKLIPRDHGFGTRRVPMETSYYEVYNQDNVLLVDVNETPIEKVTIDGIQCSDQEHPFDLIVYATGFDAVMGPYKSIKFTGSDGRILAEKWETGPSTYLGLATAGFPNMFTLVGPHNASTFCNMPRCIEQNVEWVSTFLEQLFSSEITRVEVDIEAEDEWTEHVYESVQRMLFSKVDSWFMGVNKNIEGRDTRTFMLYVGGFPSYTERCDDVAKDGYRGFIMS